MLDLYCERTGPQFWSEPFNAFTNVAFVIAALAAWRLARRQDKLDNQVRLLLILLCMIAVGSFLFHTLATRLTLWMDLLPILVFQVCFLAIYLHRIAGAGRPLIATLVALLIGSVFLMSGRPQLNGSLIYLPAFLLLLSLAIHYRAHARTGRWLLLSGLAVFACSLLLRTADQAVCDALPLGTHLYWHLLNALMMYLILAGLILNLPPRKLPYPSG